MYKIQIYYFDHVHQDDELKRIYFTYFVNKKCKNIDRPQLFVISSSLIAQVVSASASPGGQRGIGIPIGDVLTDMNKWHGATGGARGEPRLTKRRRSGCISRDPGYGALSYYTRL